MSFTSTDPTSNWSSRLRGSEHFPSPFLDMASLAMPEDIRTALKWCEYIFQANGTYRQAMERVISYFLTDVDVTALSTQSQLGDDEKEKWSSFLTESIDILGAVQQIDRDRICYGNGFVSIIVPFRRYLVCPGCGILFPLREVYNNSKFRFRFEGYKFKAKCPGCKRDGDWIVKDEPENTPDKLSLKRWSPHEIEILHDPMTDDTDYLWKIPEDYKKLVRAGRLYHLERVSTPVLEAIQHNQLFRFGPGIVYHMKEPTIAGVEDRGWGISRLITNFRQVWYVQVLHRYNEAIALDYVIPFRLITPASRGGATGASSDPLLSTNMGDFMGNVQGMIRRRRQDPAGWNTLPFPVEYQALGGEAQALAPRDLLDQGMETLLNSAGVPVDLYRGSLQLQSAPVAMRLFEASWHHLVHDNNAFLRWLVQRVSELLSWEAVTAKHKRVTHSDDMQRQMAMLQLMMGQTVSQTTGLKAMGIDWKNETRLMGEEARYMQESQAEIQEEMDTVAFGQQIARGQGGGQGDPGQPMPPGGMPPGGMPPDAGGGVPMGPVNSMVQNDMMPQTPEDMLSQAQQLAQQLLGLPESQKDSELRALKQKNEVLHSLVRAQMDNIRSQARSQGGAMLMSQEFGG